MCNDFSFEEWKELKFHVDQLKKMLDRSVDDLADWEVFKWEGEVGQPLTPKSRDHCRDIYKEYFQADGPERLSIINGLLIKLGMPDVLWNQDEWIEFYNTKDKRGDRKELAEDIKETHPHIIPANPYLNLAINEPENGY